MKFVPVSDKNNTCLLGCDTMQAVGGYQHLKCPIACIIRVKHPKDRGTRLLQSISKFILDYMASIPENRILHSCHDESCTSQIVRNNAVCICGIF